VSPLAVTVAGGVARVTIDHPPINLFDLELMQAFDEVGRRLEADPEVRVVVVDSADPDFWIAHADVNLILALPGDVPSEPDGRVGWFTSVVERFRTMPKATIAVVEGRCRGGGSELALSMDMRFGALGRTVIGQPEVPLGILPGGSGTQRLPRLVGRARALEVVLGGGDVDAETAERWGWLNRALPPGELRPFVDDLAARIAASPPEAVALAKQAVDAALPPPEPGLVLEQHLFRRLAAGDEARRRMRRFIDELGGQTREVELRLGDVLGDLGGRPGPA
jgi:enoyl-CoA hydratase/carnithine racemase